MERTGQDHDAIRAAAFAHLDEMTRRHGPYLSRAQINSLEVDGAPFALIEQKGIRKPAGWETALTITSTRTSSDRGGYEDQTHPDGSVLYRYMRESGSAARATNGALRAAADHRVPMIYFVQVESGRYEPIYPIWVGEALTEGVVITERPPTGEYADVLDVRRYAQRLSRQRLHQAEFRSRVLYAYEDRCCLCSLGRRGLLDAAHIIDDAHAAGVAAVTNGLALCRLHHGAYDQFLIGIRPDHTVHVAHDVLQEIDGPMLRHGLQEIDGHAIVLPRKHADQPDPDGLAWKYERFLEATCA